MLRRYGIDLLVIDMKTKVYWVEAVLVAVLVLSQIIDPLVVLASHRRFVMLLLFLTSVSLVIEKGRIQTPLILVLVLLSIASPSSQFHLGKVILTALILTLVLGTKRYEIKKSYSFMKRHDQKLSDLVGYRNLQIQSVSTAIYYPTSEKSSKRVKWIVGGDKFIRNTLSAFQIITHKRIPVPFWLSRFVLSYITTYDLDVEADTKITKREGYKVVFISHGITNTKHAHSSNAYWWAQRGYIVVAVQHNEDGRIIGPVGKAGDEESWKRYFEFRNQSVKMRVKELKTVITSIISQEVLNGIFGEEIKIDSFQLVGHSLGCPTIVETAAELSKTGIYQKLSAIITMDPYMFPLSESSYVNLQKPYLNLKSDKFTLDLHKLEPEMDLLSKNKRIYELNQEKMIDLTINGMDHLHQCDLIFIYGTLGQVLGMSRGNIDLVTQLNTLAIYLFQNGKSQGNIIQQTNITAKQSAGNKKIEVVPSVHP